MLVLGRKAGQWLDITHKSGDVLRVRIDNLRLDENDRICFDMSLDDDARNFKIERPERKVKTAQPATPAVGSPATG